MDNDYDVVIVGGGAAGYSAGLYSSRAGLETLLLEQMMPGGQIVNAERIENYPGFPDGILGADLAGLMQQQASLYGLHEELSEVTAVESDEPYWAVSTYDGEVRAKALIFAVGSTLRKLGVPGEDDLFGAGVSQCATCDGGFFSDQTVGVVGGGDSALDEAMVLTEFASHVLILCKDDHFSGQQVLQDRALSEDKIEVRWSTAVDEVLGESEVEGVRVTDTATGETSTVDLSGLFVYVGLEPNSGFLGELLPLDPGGHIPTDAWMRTPMPGILAAGDIRVNSASQLVTAAGDGATAAIAAQRYIEGRVWPSE